MVSTLPRVQCRGGFFYVANGSTTVLPTADRVVAASSPAKLFKLLLTADMAVTLSSPFGPFPAGIHPLSTPTGATPPGVFFPAIADVPARGCRTCITFPHPKFLWQAFISLPSPHWILWFLRYPTPNAAGRFLCLSPLGCSQRCQQRTGPLLCLLLDRLCLQLRTGWLLRVPLLSQLCLQPHMAVAVSNFCGSTLLIAAERAVAAYAFFWVDFAHSRGTGGCCVYLF